jgi:16S rRNA (uracil1498-N3)-methyltransferase
MSYPYFFISKKNIIDNSIFVSGEDFIHLAKVLRAKVGDIVEVSDNESKRYKASITEIRKEMAVLCIKEVKDISKNYPQISLFIGILKKEAMEISIQKTAEIGIDEIIPVFSSRVVIELDKDKIDSRISRWQHIATGASKQCKRDYICKVSDAVKVSSINPSLFDLFFITVENPFFNKSYISLDKLSDFLRNKKDEYKNKSEKDFRKLGYIIGPEGGFENSEIEILIQRGAIPINFGKNILRSETASIYFLSILDYLFKTVDVQ